MLRDDTADDGAPGTLADARRLVEAACAELVVDGHPRQLPAALEATVHRVVQESLTNARKHAPGAAVRVRLHWTDAALEVEVTDDGRGSAVAGEPGFGLLGMRERVALFDGRVTAGPPADGPGWRTAVVLPVPVPVPA
ncbi:MAG: ATP-binding protein [Actinomycetota bacterium]|nr:ATP-binding protein [Actinomycetota bacterium]